jgi:SNF2 family DNA or RNA helicase
MIYKPADYQREGTRKLIEHPSFGLLFDPGLGKTACVLHALKALSLMHEPFRALVIAPRLVCIDTWPAEIAKWDQFKNLSYVQMRDLKQFNFDREDPIWLINPEVSRLEKLFREICRYNEVSFDQTIRSSTYRREKLTKWPFNALVIDESRKFKNPGSKRFKLLKRFLSFFKHRYIMTGTFAPNGLLDVFSQQMILDLGETFGTAVTKYRSKYFELDNPKFYTYKIRPGAEEEIQKQIAPWVMRLDAEKHLDLPELVHNEISISLPPLVQDTYEDIEREFFSELVDGGLMAPNATAKYLLCRQMASGAYYDPQGPEKRITVPLHLAKIEALKNLIDELQGKPIIVAYVYRSDLEQIQKAFNYSLPSIGGHTSEAKARGYLDKWNRRELPVLLAQCSSISHGLNMQAGGNDLCFYSLTDNLEDYEQLIRRIYRRGVSGQVRVHYLLARNTIDRAVFRRIKNKEAAERSLLEALEEYRDEKSI